MKGSWADGLSWNDARSWCGRILLSFSFILINLLVWFWPLNCSCCCYAFNAKFSNWTWFRYLFYSFLPNDYLTHMHIHETHEEQQQQQQTPNNTHSLTCTHKHSHTNMIYTCIIYRTCRHTNERHPHTHIFYYYNYTRIEHKHTHTQHNATSIFNHHILKTIQNYARHTWNVSSYMFYFLFTFIVLFSVWLTMATSFLYKLRVLVLIIFI